MSDIQFGAGHIYAMATIQIHTTAGLGGPIGGFLTPNLKTLKLTDDTSGIDLIKNAGGIVSSLQGAGDCMVSCAVDFVPEDITRVAAAISARLPVCPSGILVNAAPIIPLGLFDDVFNTNGANAQRWFYQGGGSVSGSDGGHWVASFVMHRYFFITATAPVIG